MAKSKIPQDPFPTQVVANWIIRLSGLPDTPDTFLALQQKLKANLSQDFLEAIARHLAKEENCR